MKDYEPRIEWRDPATLTPYSNNAKTHPTEQIDKIAASIAAFGFDQPIVVDADEVIIKGHGRREASLRIGLNRVPVLVRDDLSVADARAARLADNKTAESPFDEEALRLEIEALMEQDDFDITLTGFDLPEIDELFAAAEPEKAGLIEDDEVPEAPEEPVSRPGDLWVLGEHRVLCGDATVLADVERVLSGQLADLCWTDPPYSVCYGQSAKDKLRGKHRPILNDDLGKDFGPFLFDACVNVLAVTKGAVYICMSSSELHTLYSAFTEAGGRWSTYIQWVKHAFTLGRADYQRQYEPILYGWKEGADHYWCGARDQGDVWFFDKPARNDLHPTMAERVVAAYRSTNDRIVALWRDLEHAARQAVAQPGLIVSAANGRLKFRVKADFLWLVLPSGRPLAYAKPRIEEVETPWGELRPQVTYLGVTSVTRRWERQNAYGGKWTENVVQAIARDLLAAAMLRLEQAGYPIVLSVHDEIVAEVPTGWGSVSRFEQIMCQLPAWARGCPVAAEGWRGFRYRK